MAAKNPHGNSIYDLLVDLIFDLSVLQAEKLYSELLPRYSKRARVHKYNKDGEECKDGRIRLMPYQYKALRTKFGDTYIKRAFNELDRYIEYLENNQETCSKYKAKLRDYNSKTHNNLLKEDGWVYEKCKQYVCTERPKVAINPYSIEDFATAREYIKSIPKDIRDSAIDVQMLLIKFPELIEMEEDI